VIPGEVFARTHTLPSVCPTLEKANDARRRAWRELQAIRKMLALVVDNLPPPPKPASFEAEGALLRAAVAKAIAEPWERLAALEAAVEGLKPYLSNTLQDGHYPMRVNDLNRALHRPRPEGKQVAMLRRAE
jgi:hypothetical protein